MTSQNFQRQLAVYAELKMLNTSLETDILLILKTFRAAVRDIIIIVIILYIKINS